MDEYEARLIAALTRDRQAILEKLTSEDRNHLDALLDLAAEGGDERRQKAVTRAVAAHLRAALPEDEVRAAVERRFTGTTSAPPHELLAAFASFSGLSTEPHGTRSAAPHSTGSTAPHSTGSTEPHGTEPAPADDTEAQPAPYERLLAAPALTEDDLRDNFGVEATAPELIRLRRRDGTERLPAFQFDGTGRPREVVVAVNRMLGAAEDPWGWPTGGSAPTPGWPRPRRHCSARVWTDNCSPRRAWWARRTDMARGARLPDRGTAEPKRIDWQAGQVLYRVHSQHRKAAEFNPRPAAQGT